MKQFKTVFLFELGNTLLTKAYIITTLVLAIAIAVGLSIPRFGDLFGNLFGGEEGDGISKVQIIAEPALGEELSQALSAMGMEANLLSLSHEEGIAAVQNGEYESIFYISSPASYEYIVNNKSLYDREGSLMEELLIQIQRSHALSAAGVAPEVQAAILAPEVTSSVNVLSVDQSQNYFYTYAVIFLMYMMVLLYGQLVASSVAKEKSSRAMEMLITSAKTKSFIYGKVMASALASFLQMFILLGTSFLFYQINRDYYIGNPVVSSLFAIPLSSMLYALLFFVVGFLNFAFLFGALGSTVNKVEDLNQAITPITMFFIVVYLLVSFSMSAGNLDNPAMVIASFFPLSSPMAMFARITLGNVDTMSILISIALLIASIVVIAGIAIKIYDMGVLLYGNKLKFKNILKVMGKK